MDFSECYQDTCSTVGLAARAGDARRVQRLLRKGYSLDVRDNRGWNALHEAAASGSTECVRILTSSRSMDSKDYVNSVTHNSETPLYFAAKNGHVRAVRQLLKASADINLKTHDLSCPLFAAVDEGHQEVVQLLIKQGAEVNGQRCVSGWSCLHQAAYKGHAEIVRPLSKVACLEAVDDYSITPLFLAAQYGHRQCVEVLAEAGANVNSQATDLATPMLIAAQEGHLGCVEALLSHSANPNLYCNRDQWQLPIHAAAQFAHIRVLERLLEVTDRDCERNEARVSPLYQAVLSERPGSLETLLRAGYHPDAQPCFGYTCPLELAMESSYRQGDEGMAMVRLLLEAGVAISDQAYSLALNRAPLLQLLLSCRGLPSSPAAQESLASLALAEMENASSWLPLLLRSGMTPSLLLDSNFVKMSQDGELAFLLEFFNWRCLPPHISAAMSRRHTRSSGNTRKLLEGVPTLAHLCRLRLHEIMGSLRLADGAFVQRLPIPSLLHDYVQFKDIYSRHCNTIGGLTVGTV